MKNWSSGLRIAVLPRRENTRMDKPSYLNFDKSKYQWRSGVDYRANPEKYRVGKGEQGVLICEPYKSELVTHWRFKTPESAVRRSTKCFLFISVKGDFVGADMARKFLEMGFTRARRYTNYKRGRKYDPDDKHPLEKGTGDPRKALSAEIFYEAWQRAEAKPAYASLKAEWKQNFG